MTTVAAIFARAVAEHRSGRIESAAMQYRLVLTVDPGHALARHLLGFALLQARATAEAEATLEEALRQSPLTPAAWTHLGIARAELGRPAGAAEAFRRALILTPDRPEAQHGLTRTPVDAGPPAGDRQARRLVVLDPRSASGWHRLALALAAADPGYPASRAALAAITRAAALDPSDAPALTDLSNILRSRRKPVAARRLALRALCIAPPSSAARVALAAALFDLDFVESAVAAARPAAVLAPQSAEAYGNLAQCSYRRARFDHALLNGRRARAIKPDDPQIRANLSTYHLAFGELERGWALFGDRPARRAIARSRQLPGPTWAGAPGARLLVLAEQGLGDEILFASCWADLADLRRRGGIDAVCVETDARLRPLAERSFPELQWLDREPAVAVTARGRHARGFAATHWVAAGDLPSLFRRSLADFPAEPRYLAPDPARVAGFRRWLESEAPGQRRLGLCWRSGLRTEDRTKHYPEFADCRPLFRIPGVRIVILQYDDCAAEIAGTFDPADNPVLQHPDLDRRNDLDGVAALMAALDGVLSAETAVLALAGAVGVPGIGFDLGPTWVALGQRRNPWHPSVARLHRRDGEPWVDLMARVGEAQAGLPAGRAE